MKATIREILTWEKQYLGEIMSDVADNLYKDYWISEAALAGIACREYCWLVPRKVNAGQSFEYIAAHAIGDNGHGRSFWQIDDRSYPDWIAKHPLSDVKAYCIKAVEVLKEKERSLNNAGFTREKLGDELYERAIFASYNCGQGNVIKVLRNGQDIDSRTYSKDYSKTVMQYRKIYNDLFYPDKIPAEGMTGIEPESEIPEYTKA